MKLLQAGALVLLLGLCPGALRADEGFWPLDNFPAERVRQTYGFAPDQPWLDRVRATTVILGNCTGTFVSPSGLVLVDRSCVTSCLGMRAAVKRTEALFGEACRDRALRKGIPLFDLLYCAPLDREEQRQSDRASFVARSSAEELACTGRYLRQLVSMEDVTERMRRKLDQAGPDGMLQAQRVESREIQRACQTSESVECEVVESYDGARWELHRYRAFRDVRLVFSPEASVAAFGVEGSPFTFPQHQFTAALVRVYEGGKPAQTPHLKLAESTVREGQPVFAAGYPGGTQRRTSVASLQLARESNSWALPIQTEVRGMMHQYAKDKLDPASVVAVDGAFAASVIRLRGTLRSLSPELMTRVQERERVLRARVDADPKLARRYGQAWDAQAQALLALLRSRRSTLANDIHCGSLYETSRDLVRAADELAKPNAERLPEFIDLRLPALERYLLRPIPFDESKEGEYIAFCFRLFQEELGYADPLFKKMVQGQAPDAAAKEMIHHTRLPDLSVRRALWKGGRAAVQASTDPLIALWRRIDGDLRASRKLFEEQVARPLVRANTQIGRARFEIFGASEYPDANSTLRISSGKVTGTTGGDKTLAAFEPLSAAFGLATGKPPFELPARWLEAKGTLDLAMPLAFTTSTDIAAGTDGRGHVGAPLIDKTLTVVGMITGGNEGAEASDYDFKPESARAVALNSAAILQVLEHVYAAESVVQELRAARP